MDNLFGADGRNRPEYVQRRAQIDAAAQNMVAYIAVHTGLLKEHSGVGKDKYTETNKKIEAISGGGIRYTLRNLVQILVGIRPVSRELKEAVAKMPR